jgi:prevent-host-death family protein
VLEAKEQLAELIARVNAGEEVVVTDDGRGAVRLVPAEPERPQRTRTREERAAVIDAIVERAAAKMTPGPDAAHAADFLDDEHGLPA